jgi:hypothetical protein
LISDRDWPLGWSRPSPCGLGPKSPLGANPRSEINFRVWYSISLLCKGLSEQYVDSIRRWKEQYLQCMWFDLEFFELIVRYPNHFTIEIDNNQMVILVQHKFKDVFLQNSSYREDWKSTQKCRKRLFCP